jgi:hypothetical protein
MIIDLHDHKCKNDFCQTHISENREYCYVCDLIYRNKQARTPNTIHDLVDEFLHNSDLSDHEAEDVIHIFDKFEKHVETKKYRITIQ